MDQSGTLVFLLFLPLLWVVWLAVILLSFRCVMNDADFFLRLLDDRKQACYHISHIPDILQLPRHGVFCERGQFPGQVENWAL